MLTSVRTRRESADGQIKRLQPYASEVCTWVYRTLSSS